jgi:hypothetical protein
MNSINENKKEIIGISGKESFIILLAKELADALKLDNKNLQCQIQNGKLVIGKANGSENDSSYLGGGFHD